jgi:hypothetical protein
MESAAELRRNMLMSQNAKHRLDSIAATRSSSASTFTSSSSPISSSSRQGNSDSTSSSSPTLGGSGVFSSSRQSSNATASSSPPRRPVGASSIFSSSPPIGLQNLTRSTSSCLPSNSSSSTQRSNNGVFVSAPALPAARSGGSHLVSSFSWRSVLLRYRRRCLLLINAVLGCVLGCAEKVESVFFLWLLMSSFLMTLFWATESTKLFKQIVSCKSASVAILVSLQYLPTVKTQLLDLMDGFAFFFAFYNGASLCCK